MRWATVGLLAAAGASLAACGSTSDHRVSIPGATTLTTMAYPAGSTGTLEVTPTTSTSPRTTGPVELPTTTTSVPCSLSGRSGPSESIPITQVCSSIGAPHFDTPQAAMAYLADAWNANDVQQIDYVTDPNGRQELDSMANVLVNLRFTHCTPNPAGDYTCYFMHNIIPSTSPTTYPNPMNYPPGEAVFTVAPAATPGWYLTNVLHCG